MPNFDHLLKRPEGGAKRPPALYPDLYPARVNKFEFGDNNRQRTPYVRFFFAYTGWGDSVPDSWSETNGKGETREVLRSSIDLSKVGQFLKQRDFYLTEDALYRLEEFLVSCGITVEGDDYRPAIEEAVGADILVEVTQRLNAETNETSNQIGKLVGSGG